MFLYGFTCSCWLGRSIIARCTRPLTPSSPRIRKIRNVTSELVPVAFYVSKYVPRKPTLHLLWSRVRIGGFWRGEAGGVHVRIPRRAMIGDISYLRWFRTSVNWETFSYGCRISPVELQRNKVSGSFVVIRVLPCVQGMTFRQWIDIALCTILLWFMVLDRAIVDHLHSIQRKYLRV